MTGPPTLTLDRPPAAGPGETGGAPDGLERALMRGLLIALIAEGRRFAGTPAGERWRRVLGEASPAREGAARWGAAGLDLFLRGTDRGPGSPRAMADDILALLAAEGGTPAPGLVMTVVPQSPGAASGHG